MVMLNHTVEENQQQEFEPIPTGEYIAAIVKSEMKETKAGNGEYLNLSFQILLGSYKGRYIFDMLNLKNPNEKAVFIAKQRLNEIGKALKLHEIKDSCDLHDKPLKIKVRLVDGRSSIYGYNEAYNIPNNMQSIKQDEETKKTSDEFFGEKPAISGDALKDSNDKKFEDIPF